MKRILYALRFMTVIPLPYKQDEDMTDVARSLALFPLAGLLIGLILWGTARLALLFLPPLTSGFILMTASLILTGGLHLDGLSDLADGLGGGRDRERRLEIMKDSRLGAFGALALIAFLLMKGLFFYELIRRAEIGDLMILTLPPLWARGFAVLVIKTFPTARPGGMGDFFRKNARTADLAAALIFTLAGTAGLLFLSGKPALILLILPAFLLMLIPAFLISRQLKGLTGDCYGALIEGTELLGLILLTGGVSVI